MGFLKIIFPLIVSFLVCPNSLYANTSYDVVTRFAWRANKLCLIKNSIELKNSGLTRASVMEQGDNILNCFPENSGDKDALKHFADIIGISNYNSSGLIRGANEGIINYYQREIDKNPCFEGDLEKFHKSVNQLNSESISSLQTLRNAPLKFRPSLNSNAGNGPYENFKPGWIWEKAMAASDGDARRALSLINICGNDDVLTKPITLSAGTNLNCGAVTSVGYFAPESLGEGYDISPELKKKIVDTQYPDKGASYAPGKYYHVYNSAFLTCELISKGMKPGDAADLSALLASTYRAMRLRERVVELNGYRSTYEDKKNSGEIPEDVNFKQFIEKDRREFWLQMHGNDDPARINRLVNSDVERFDAVFLMKRWELGSALPILGTPLYTNLQISPKNRRDIPAGWSKQRFDGATKRLETFIVDSDWSTAQARVGASFATKHCKKQENPEVNLSCQKETDPPGLDPVGVEVER